MPTKAQPLLDQPSTIERRFYPRIAASTPAYIAMVDARQCMLLNVSENGLLLSTPATLPCNFVARIALPLVGLAKAVQVNVRVVWASESGKLAGIQLLDLTDEGRQQIRKWAMIASAPPNQWEVQQEPKQTRPIDRPFPPPAEQPKAGSAVLSKPPVRVSPPIALSAYPLPSGARNESTSLFDRIAKWAVPLGTICLVGIFFFQLGAMEHSFAHSSEIPPPDGTLPPANESPLKAQPPNSSQRISLESSSADTDKHKGESAAAIAPQDSQPVESKNNHESMLDSPISTSLAPPRSEPYRNANRSPRTPDTPTEASKENRGNAVSVVAPREGSPTSDTTAAASSSVPELPAPAAPPSPVVKESAAEHATRLNDVAPNVPTTLSRANVPPPHRTPKSFTAVSQPVIQMDPPARQVVDIHLPNGYRSRIFDLPGERVLESPSTTVRIERSVRLPPTHPRWPFHHDTRIVVGGLIARVDPAVASVRSGATEDVRVQAMVAQDGHVELVRPISGAANLLPAVVKAVQEWRYQPTLIDGKPVETQADVFVQFHPPSARTSRP